MLALFSAFFRRLFPPRVCALKQRTGRYVTCPICGLPKFQSANAENSQPVETAEESANKKGNR